MTNAREFTARDWRRLRRMMTELGIIKPPRRPSGPVDVGAQPTSVEDCFARIARADVHLKALHRTLGRFAESGAYTFRAEIDEKTVPYLPTPPDVPSWMPRFVDQIVFTAPIDPREIVIRARVIKPIPAQSVGLLVGDIVNNLRSALDAMIWHLSVTHTPLPTPEPKEWREVRWPIVRKRADWPSALGSNLRFVDQRVHATVEWFQPFVRRKRWPSRDEFAVLDELWRVHKHRHLALTQLWVGPLEEVLSRFPEWYARHPRAEPEIPAEVFEHAFAILWRRPRGPLKDGTVIGRVRQVGPIRTDNPQVDVKAVPPVDVGFEKGPPAYGRPVEGTLRVIRDEVQRALDALSKFV